jgi:3-oxoacyl-[acyl-carrier protein] reductase
VDEAVGELGRHLERGRIMGVAGDLSRRETIDRTLKAIAADWGTVEVLVANIGTGTARPGWELDDRDWDLSFEANLHASRRLVEGAMPAMLERGRGSIIFIASIAGLESLNAPLTYSAAKAALVSYAKNLSRLVARRGVRVNTVAPGNILFEGGSWARKIAERGEDVRRYIDAEVPAGRFGGTDEIADVVTFLASDRAAFVTGACLVADGGQTRGYR